MKRLILVLLACCACGGLFADGSAAVVPEPYKASEFPAWALDLRRFEIVTLGAFPFAVFVAGEALDLSRLCFGASIGLDLSRIGSGNPFVVTSVTAGDVIYAPWPVKSSASYSTTDDEKVLTIVVAATLAIGVGVADYLIVKAQKRAEIRRKAAIRSEAPESGSDAPAPEQGASGAPPPGAGEGGDGSRAASGPASPEPGTVQP